MSAIRTMPQSPDFLNHETWMQEASCRGLSPRRADELFFSMHETTNEAKRMCASCPVSGSCTTFADRNSEQYGVWGGKRRDRGR